MLKIATAAFAAAAALVAAAPASAATTVNTDIGTINTLPAAFAGGVNVTAGSITSTYNFTLNLAQTLNSSSFTVADGTPFSFTSVTLSALGSSTALASSTSSVAMPDGGSAIGLGRIALGTGSYTITVLGTASGESSIGHSIRFAAAVPEPATWAMMLVGFGMVGAASRYRRRNTAVAYA